MQGIKEKENALFCSMKKIFTILLVLGLATGIGLFFLKADRTYPNVLAQSKIQSILKVSDVEYKVSLSQGSSAYDLMEAAKTQGLNFQERQFAGLGVFIDEINGVKSSQKDGKYWIYYINGQKAQVGISSYIIKPNDVISWKYEKSTY